MNQFFSMKICPPRPIGPGQKWECAGIQLKTMKVENIPNNSIQRYLKKSGVPK